MNNTENRLKPTERKISGAAIALGVVAFLVLAGGFFFVGMTYIGPMLNPHADTTPSTEQAAQVPPENKPAKEEALVTQDSAGKDALDIQITEQADKTQLTVDAAESGVKQDENNITVTLDPNENSADTGQSTADQSVGKDKKEPVPTPTETTQNQGSKIRYHIQVGTFANKVNADNLAAELRDKGYKPQITTVHREAGVLYRVELGDYKTRQGAESLAQELSQKGYNPTVTGKASD